jgi:hypothetical protein
MSIESAFNWFEESDQALLARHRQGNVIGISGYSYWQKMERLEELLKRKNLL